MYMKKRHHRQQLKRRFECSNPGDMHTLLSYRSNKDQSMNQSTLG